MIDCSLINQYGNFIYHHEMSDSSESKINKRNFQMLNNLKYQEYEIYNNLLERNIIKFTRRGDYFFQISTLSNNFQPQTALLIIKKIN
jgi:hypothetical protein